MLSASTRTPRRYRWTAWLVVYAGVLACTFPAATGVPEETQPPTAPAATPLEEVTEQAPPPAPTVTTAAPYPTPALDGRPLAWFAPLPPMPTHAGRPYIGSDDFMDLFVEDAPWQEAAQSIQVFKFYGEWVAYHATDAQLRQAFTDVQRRGLAVALEAGPLDPPPECGEGIESFAGLDEWAILARRVKQAGGTLHFVAMDEPYFFAHIYDGPKACHWDGEKIAQEVAEFIDAVHADFPDAVVGDTEPLPGGVMTADYITWLETFRAVNGYNLPFIHYDFDFGRMDWVNEALAMESYTETQGIDFGLIYFGSHNAGTDEEWLSQSGEHVIAYELNSGGEPDHVLFQSWQDHPDAALPESEPYTYTGFVRRYGEDRASLGFRTEGPGVNLARGKSVTTSAATGENPAALAVDGNPDSFWGSGGPPVQWIQVDLGEPYAIAAIRLTVEQYPAGATTHRVYVRGPGTGGVETLAQTFTGQTQSFDLLVFEPDTPLQGIQFVRVETTASPSWAAWREIEVISGE